jgi:hypothetical protein
MNKRIRAMVVITGLFAFAIGALKLSQRGPEPRAWAAVGSALIN